MGSAANNEKREIESLPLGKVMHIAWRGIRIRIWRSLLVVSGIVLAVAFLSYILCSDSFTRHVRERGSQELIDRLARDGVLEQGDVENQRVQTYWMVGLALMISFVGIVNAMLMSVTERFREIGTMKCLGAFDSFVLRLFLLESFFEGAVGTTFGLAIGVGIAYLEGWTIYHMEVWGLIPGAEVAIVVAGCFVTGLVLTVLGALYPAYQAARMEPVVALRSEI